MIVSEDTTSFAHVHGEQVGPDGLPHDRTSQTAAPAPESGPFGPEIGFRYVFPRPGLYKVWGQFQATDGQLITADFVVRAQ